MHVGETVITLHESMHVGETVITLHESVHVGETVITLHECGNGHDKHVMAIYRDSEARVVVGHLPREITKKTVTILQDMMVKSAGE